MTALQPPSGAAAPRPEAPAWSDPARASAFQQWMASISGRHHLLPASVRLASADASFRRYFRVDASAGAPTRIVMDAPPAQENSAPFVQVAQLMAEAGVRAPQVLEWESADGFLLLDDLGRQTMLDVIDPNDPQAARPLYDQAIDALIRWQLASRPGVLPPYDRALLERELALFPDWYIARHRGIAVEGTLKERLERSFKAIVENNLAAAPVYVHRDFMPRNLMVGDADALGVLDFQDAVYGPVTYDIASLMRDAFLSWDEEFVLDVTVRYWERARKAGLPVDPDFGAFYRTVEWMGLQRHLKVAGIFARLTLRDGKPKYLADTPRFIAYIRATAGRYRELTPLLRVVDEIEGTQAQTGFAYGRM
ncbi:aminoglycoside phosphotransferase family protein [Variovorax ginsengisoli]|uniref:Phosphotransferase n=1 Tax=Variovorax ginsengisoli TaxID=363844 RepID=A0ABT8RY76_9BURK|nr:phosphotransferase [Variovorax ginsengisoli]MDN8612175.1 phosphotransferase [Variovorax ginsengisoli]MDO1531345.1 phosphotransferase [Variovorax ginsengisoli]